MIKVPSKIGFHTGPGGNPTGIGDYMRALDKAGIPMVLKSVDHYGPVFEAQEMMRKSQEAGQLYVPHVLIFRLSDRHGGPGDDYKYDTPPYKDPKYVNNPEGGAELHWKETLAKLPPEFDKKRVWLEVMNEVDRNLAWWLGRFALRIMDLAERDGYKVSFFGFAGGEPEPEFWETPEVLIALRRISANRSRFAVALHEYSFLVSDIWHESPFKIGRFQYLFYICDKHNIPRPTVHITEWGWTLDNVPGPETAIKDMKAVGELYARFPEIEAVATWYLGAGFSEIANKAQKLIKPVTDWTLKTTFEVEEGSPAIVDLPATNTWSPDAPVDPQPQPNPNPIDPPAEGEDMNCKPRVPYAREYFVVPQSITLERYLEICEQAFNGRKTVAFSYDDAGHAPGVSSNTVVLYDIPAARHQEFIDWYATHYPGTAVFFAGAAPEDYFRFEVWPTNHKHVTQKFGANPANYVQFGLHGHEGLDIRAPHDSAVYAVADGVVVKTGDDRENKANGGHNYGVRVYINHANGWQTVYAHLNVRHVGEGDLVKAGDVIGQADNTGNSFGSHLHITLKRPGYSYTDQQGRVWPFNIFDPTPAIAHLDYTAVGDPEPAPAPIPDPDPTPAPGPTPPTYHGPAVKFTPAIHQPGSDWMWNMPGVSGLISYLDMPVKWLSDGINADFFAKYNKSAFHLVRLNWKTTVYRTPAEAWAEVRDGALRFYNRGARRFEVLNELNLGDEGMGVLWNNGDECGIWLGIFITMAKAEMPEAQFYFPGMSPGVPWTNQFAFTNAAWPHVAHLCYGACIHAYTGITDNVAAAIDDIVMQVKGAQSYKWLDRPLVVSESSVNRAASAAYKAAVYRGVEQALANVPGIEAVCWYISHWDPPAAQKDHQESWFEIGLAEKYKGA